MQRALFVVEGPHDVAVIRRLLATRGLTLRREASSLDPFWRRIVPSSFPVDDDLLKRVPVPTFFASDDHSVAVHAAGGVDRVVPQVRQIVRGLSGALNGLGVMVDADDVDVSLRWGEVGSALSAWWQELQHEGGAGAAPGAGAALDLGGQPGAVGGGPLRTGVFVAPDNQRAGAIEELLVDCAAVAYPGLLTAARAFVDPLVPPAAPAFPAASDRAELNKPQGPRKALVGAIGAVLKPGKSIQVSVRDNQWFKASGVAGLPAVAALQAWVDAVIG